MRPVTLSPSVPASGLSLTRKVIASVGGSMGWAGSGSVTSGSAMVSATFPSSSPATATMSPAWASSTATRLRPRKASTLVVRPLSTRLPSRASTFTFCPALMEPDVMRPVRTRPR